MQFLRGLLCKNPSESWHLQCLLRNYGFCSPNIAMVAVSLALLLKQKYQNSSLSVYFWKRSIGQHPWILSLSLRFPFLISSTPRSQAAPGYDYCVPASNVMALSEHTEISHFAEIRQCTQLTSSFLIGNGKCKQLSDWSELELSTVSDFCTLWVLPLGPMWLLGRDFVIWICLGFHNVTTQAFLSITW